MLFPGLAVLGGRWLPIGVLPQALQAFAWALASWHLAEFALMAVGQGQAAHGWLHAGPLLLSTAAAALLAVTGARASTP